MVMKGAGRLFWQGVLGGVVIGFLAAGIVTYVAQTLGLVPPHQSPHGTYLLWVVVAIVWFLAVLLTTSKEIPRN
jgi:hypothetical protein